MYVCIYVYSKNYISLILIFYKFERENLSEMDASQARYAFVALRNITQFAQDVRYVLRSKSQ